MRLTYSGIFHHLTSYIRTQKRPSCQIRGWSGVKQLRAQIIELSTCKLTLFHTYYNVFHTTHYLCDYKNDLKKILEIIDKSQIGDNNDDKNVNKSVSVPIVGI